MIKYVSALEANTESIDIISSYCANTAFEDRRLSIETIDFVKNPSKNQNIRKYVAFKTLFRLVKS